jgi:PIN domain nuclease of toxin-antitoxin system
MLVAIGRIAPQENSQQWIAELIAKSGVVIKEITPAVAALSTSFPKEFPRDPADRLIGATARSENLVLITRDREIRTSNLLKTVW